MSTMSSSSSGSVNPHINVNTSSSSFTIPSCILSSTKICVVPDHSLQLSPSQSDGGNPKTQQSYQRLRVTKKQEEYLRFLGSDLIVRAGLALNSIRIQHQEKLVKIVVEQEIGKIWSQQPQAYEGKNQSLEQQYQQSKVKVSETNSNLTKAAATYNRIPYIANSAVIKGQIIFHRFFYRRSMARYDVRLVAGTCVVLGIKYDEGAGQYIGNNESQTSSNLLSIISDSSVENDYVKQIVQEVIKEKSIKSNTTSSNSTNGSTDSTQQLQPNFDSLKFQKTLIKSIKSQLKTLLLSSNTQPPHGLIPLSDVAEVIRQLSSSSSSSIHKDQITRCELSILSCLGFQIGELVRYCQPHKLLLQYLNTLFGEVEPVRVKKRAKDSTKQQYYFSSYKEYCQAWSQDNDKQKNLKDSDDKDDDDKNQIHQNENLFLQPIKEPSSQQVQQPSEDLFSLLTHRSYAYLNDSFRSDVSCRFPTNMLTVACIELARRDYKIYLPRRDWWRLYDVDLGEGGGGSESELKDCMKRILKVYVGSGGGQ